MNKTEEQKCVEYNFRYTEENEGSNKNQHISVICVVLFFCIDKL